MASEMIMDKNTTLDVKLPNHMAQILQYMPQESAAFAEDFSHRRGCAERLIADHLSPFLIPR